MFSCFSCAGDEISRHAIAGPIATNFVITFSFFSEWKTEHRELVGISILHPKMRELYASRNTWSVIPVARSWEVRVGGTTSSALASFLLAGYLAVADIKRSAALRLSRKLFIPPQAEPGDKPPSRSTSRWVPRLAPSPIHRRPCSQEWRCCSLWANSSLPGTFLPLLAGLAQPGLVSQSCLIRLGGSVIIASLGLPMTSNFISSLLARLHCCSCSLAFSVLGRMR